MGPVEFRLLGPVSVLVHGRPATLGLRQLRLVLAVLALEANRLVTVERLVDLLWPEQPPETARRVIHSQISRLRSALAKAGADQHGVVVRGTTAGYVLVCDSSTVDIQRFGHLLASARDTDDETRVAVLDDALALWRGPALAGTATEVTRAELCGYLEEARLSAIEDRLAALLRLGRHRVVVDEAIKQSAEHPFRHRLTMTLMLALHRSGRTADALTVYQQAKHRLADELGLDPPAELAQVQLDILREDHLPAPPALSRPTQLPADVGAFVGRTTELNELLAAWPPQRPTAGVVISAIEGMAGVGKTTLAVHAAHQLARHFPDGQLFIDLHGHSQHMPPIEPADALDRLLRALGVTGEQIPPHLEDRAALLRTTLTGRRVLMVLDNAATAAQVQPLLPGTPGCLMLITSRRRLTELDEAHLMVVDGMPLPDAVALFSNTVGPDRIADTPPRLVVDIAELCGRLPLAIRIAAARLHSHPTWTLSHLADRLRDQQRRLDELEAGQRSVTAALNLSYDHLGEAERRAYRLLGLHPGPTIDTHAMAALTGTSPADTERVLDALLDAHLLDEPTPGRYSFHDLTRAHAGRTGERHESADDQNAALRRLIHWYLATAESACRHLELQPIPRTPSALAGAVADQQPIVFTGRADALDWLECERPNIQAAIAEAVRRDHHQLVWQLVFALHPFLQVRKYDSLHNLQLAFQAADQPMAKAQALINMSVLYQEQGQYSVAEEKLREALTMSAAAGDQRGQAWALWGLGLGHWGQGQYTRAEQEHQQALTICQETGDRRCAAWVHCGLGLIHMVLGEYPEAEQHFRDCLTLCREVGDPYGEAWALCDLGLVCVYLGEYARAEKLQNQALAIRHQIGDRRGEAWALYGLGLAYSHTGQYPRAERHHQQALTIFQQTSDRYGEAWALNGLGLAYSQTGQHPRAEQHHRQALDIRRQIGDREGEAWALLGLGIAYRGLGELTRAEDHQQQALTIFQSLGRQAQPTTRERLDDVRATHGQVRS